MKKHTTNLKTLIFGFVALIFSSPNLFGFDKRSTNDLLMSNLANDIELQKLTIQAEKAILDYDMKALGNGITINLSSGSVIFKTAGDDLTVIAHS